MVRLRVGVLMGGKSVENEVSFNSGRTVCDHLDTMRYEAIPLFQTREGILYKLPWRFLHRGKTTDFSHRLKEEAETVAWDDLSSIIDFAFIAMHGRFGEDGTMQGVLEVLGIPYFGANILASSLAMDKIMQRIILKACGINVPKAVIIERSQLDRSLEDLNADLATADIKFPCIVKSAHEGSSLGVYMVKTSAALPKAIKNAAHITPGITQPVIIEEFIIGMEFSCIVLTHYETKAYMPLPPTEIVPEEGSYIFDYHQKYMPGRAHKYTPARCSKEIITLIQKSCIATMAALEITNIARIDGFVTHDNTIIIIEPNSFCGLAPSSFIFNQAAEIGMGYRQVINHLIDTELTEVPQ